MARGVVRAQEDESRIRAATTDGVRVSVQGGLAWWYLMSSQGLRWRSPFIPRASTQFHDSSA